MELLTDIVLRVGSSAVGLALFLLLPVTVMMLAHMRLLEARGCGLRGRTWFFPWLPATLALSLAGGLLGAAVTYACFGRKLDTSEGRS